MAGMGNVPRVSLFINNSFLLQMSLDFDSIPRAHPLRQSGTSRIQVDRFQNVKVSVRSHSTKSSRRSKKTNSKRAKIQPKTQSYCCCESSD